MDMKIGVVFIFLNFIFGRTIVNAQANSILLDSCRTFDNINDAKMEPVKACILNLAGKELKAIPIEIFGFPNMKVLILSCSDKSTLTVAEKDSLIHQHKYMIIDFINYGQADKCNYIKRIPRKIINEFKKLEKLELIDLSENNINKRQVRRLQNSLPNVEIIWDGKE